MKHPSLFLSACLTVLTWSLHAQTDFQAGYYITHQLDTIYGEIDNRGDIRNCQICTYRSMDGEEILTFEPGEIIAYRFSGDGRYYISKEVNINGESREVYLEFLVNGISNLYYYRGEAQDRYYLESQEGEFTELTNERMEFQVDGIDYARYSNLYVGQMKASFGDCPEIQSKVENARFSHKSLIQLTSEYHDYVCDGELCIVYEKPLPVVQFSGGLYAGFIKSSLAIPEYHGTGKDFGSDAGYKWYHYYTFQKQTDFMMGLRFRFTLPRVSDKMAMLLLMEYNASNYHSYVEEQTYPGLLTQMEANVHVSTMQVMTGIQYTYSRGRIRPSLALGPVLSIDLNSYYDMDHTLITDERVIVQDFHTEPIRDLVMGGFSQLGVDWAITGLHHLGCNLRYHLCRQRTEQYINRDGLSLSLYYNFTFN